MNIFFKWTINNLSNIFGFIGIILTLYFGVFYVPSWLKETRNEKIINAEKNLQQSIKELIYSDSVCTYKEVQTLINAKELVLNEKYPYSTSEVFTKIQESFMQDRFLPLEKRKKLIYELELLKNEVPKFSEDIIKKNKSESKLFAYEILSIVITLLTVVVGIISFFFKYKTNKDKDEEIKNQIISNINEEDNFESGVNYQKQIIDTIKKHPGVEELEVSSHLDIGYDYKFLFKGKKYYVEVKFLNKSKVGLKSFSKFLSFSKGLSGEFWFIYNTDITEMVKQKAKDMNQFVSPKSKYNLIKTENETNFKQLLKQLLPTTPAHS